MWCSYCRDAPSSRRPQQCPLATLQTALLFQDFAYTVPSTPVLDTWLSLLIHACTVSALRDPTTISMPSVVSLVQGELPGAFEIDRLRAAGLPAVIAALERRGDLILLRRGGLLHSRSQSHSSAPSSATHLAAVSQVVHSAFTTVMDTFYGVVLESLAALSIVNVDVADMHNVGSVTSPTMATPDSSCKPDTVIVVVRCLESVCATITAAVAALPQDQKLLTLVHHGGALGDAVIVSLPQLLLRQTDASLLALVASAHSSSYATAIEASGSAASAATAMPTCRTLTNEALQIVIEHLKHTGAAKEVTIGEVGRALVFDSAIGLAINIEALTALAELRFVDAQSRIAVDVAHAKISVLQARARSALKIGDRATALTLVKRIAAIRTAAASKSEVALNVSTLELALRGAADTTVLVAAIKNATSVLQVMHSEGGALAPGVVASVVEGASDALAAASDVDAVLREPIAMDINERELERELEALEAVADAQTGDNAGLLDIGVAVAASKAAAPVELAPPLPTLTRPNVTERLVAAEPRKPEMILH